MNSKYITTSLMLAVLASGKSEQILGMPETKACLENHLLIWHKTILISEHSIVKNEDQTPAKTVS